MGADDYIAKPFSQRLLLRPHPHDPAPRGPRSATRPGR
jgi:hypothetical protein